jgi:hypothetical protein
MTATFNQVLLKLLTKMLNMVFTPHCIFWSNKSHFQKRHIHIRTTYTSKPKRILKRILHESLSQTIFSKAIICGNVAKSLSSIQDEVRIWMTDPKSYMHGTTVLVVGSEDTIRKKLYTIQFTRRFEANEIEDRTVFTPRVLIGTSGCIGAGVDCNDVHLVARMGMPTSIIHLIQEMGRCGRSTQGEYEMIHNEYHLMFNLKEFVYLNERLFYEDDSNKTAAEHELEQQSGENNNVCILSRDEERLMMQQHLLTCAKLMTLGVIVGVAVGDAFGMSLGMVPGVSLGVIVGVAVGDAFGMSVGMVPGVSLGVIVGVAVGDAFGMSLGRVLGMSLGVIVGVAVGDAFGMSLGMLLGVSLGVIMVLGMPSVNSSISLASLLTIDRITFTTSSSEIFKVDVSTKCSNLGIPNGDGTA